MTEKRSVLQKSQIDSSAELFIRPSPKRSYATGISAWEGRILALPVPQP